MLTRSVRTDIPGRSTPCVDEPASRNSIHAPRGSPVMHLEDQAPLLRGCPDRGGERPAKGGGHALRSNVWGDAQCASRPTPDQYRVTTAGCPPRIHAPRGSPVIHLEEQAPLLRGCPDRGGERPAKGGGHALRSNVWGDAQSASRPAPVQYRVTTAGCPPRIHAPRGSPVMHLEDQAPLLRGCPDRGGERQAKGGAHTLRSNVWGDAQSASRPAPDKEKGLPKGSPFSLSGGEGGIRTPEAL